MRRVKRVILIMASAAALISLGVPSAFAVATITSFSPTSGPVGCTVDVTGTGFLDFPPAQLQVAFVSPTNVATNASDVQIISPTELLAVVPAGLTLGVEYRLRLTQPAGTATSVGTFLVTSGPGGCVAPVITSFTPTSGPMGTTVTIVGTGLGGANSVTFNGKPASFTVNSSTQITTVVPDGATTGPISVTTPSGTATSATSFTVSGATPGASNIQVVTTTEPEICGQVDTFGVAPVLPTRVTVPMTSNLLVYFSSEWSGLEANTELLLNFQVHDDEGNSVASTPFEWGVSNNPRIHNSGTVMWSFDDMAPGAYDVFVDARTDPVPGPAGGGNTNNNPSAAMENCALTVFVNPVAPQPPSP